MSAGETDLLDDPLLASVPTVQGFKYLAPTLLFRRVGEGGFGCVYQARHLKFTFPFDCAVKCLRAGMGADRFEREALLGATLSHPNLVRVFDTGRAGGLHYLVMEWVDGETVTARARRHPSGMPPDEAVEIVRQATAGLAALHAKRIVHRDIKPDNLMIDLEGVVKVADLGIAKVDADEGLTMAGTAIGTVRYMSPEQHRSGDDLGPTADVFSLGATLYRMLSGQDGLKGDRYECLDTLVGPGFPLLAVTRPDLPTELAAVVDRCTRTDPKDRFADAAELGRALDGLGLDRVDLSFPATVDLGGARGGAGEGPTKEQVERAAAEVEQSFTPPTHDRAITAITEEEEARTALSSPRGKRSPVLAIGALGAVAALAIAWALGAFDGAPESGRSEPGRSEPAANDDGAGRGTSPTAARPTDPGPADEDDGEPEPPTPEPDTTPPALRVEPIESPEPVDVGATGVVVVRGTTDDDAVRVAIEGDGVSRTTVPTGGEFRVELRLAEGEHELRVVATDAAGNASDAVEVGVSVRARVAELAGFRREPLPRDGDPTAEGFCHVPIWEGDVPDELDELRFVRPSEDVVLLALTELSHAQLAAIEEATGESFGAVVQRGNLPVDRISLERAEAIARALTGLLPDDAGVSFVVPTRADWVAFVRANAGSANAEYPYPGDDHEQANFGRLVEADNPAAAGSVQDATPQLEMQGEARPVLDLPQGRSRIRSLAGNVGELCRSSGELPAVAMGGDYRHVADDGAVSAERRTFPASGGYPRVGLRLAVEIANDGSR